jgi:hypothetical protein
MKLKPVRRRSVIRYAALLGYCGLSVCSCSNAGAQSSAVTAPVRPSGVTAQPPSAAGLAASRTAQPASPSLTATEQPGLLQLKAAEPFGPVRLTETKFGTTRWTHAELLRALAGAPLSDLHPVGHTSIVFRAKLGAPFRAAYKLATREREFAPFAEVAAYRLATCLGMNNVPPAVLRTSARSQLQQLLAPDAIAKWPTIAQRLLPGEVIQGAAIFWIEGLQDAPFADQAHSPSALEPRRLAPPLAAGLITMQVFDYLIGNWDRWSGGNIKTDPDGNLYVHDNDAAFPKGLTTQQEQRLFAPLQSANSLPEPIVENLRHLTRATLNAAFLADPILKNQPGTIEETRLNGFFERRTKLLSTIERRGEAP